MKYFIDNKEVSEWRYFNALNQAQSRFAINPIHDFELLKEFRRKMFKNAVDNFIQERNKKGLETSDVELSAFYYAWLRGELKTIEFWMSDKYPKGQPKIRPSTSDQIEILKYEAWIKSEKDKYSHTTKKLNKPCPSETRARAFCILLLQNIGQEPQGVGQTELINISKKYFPKNSGRTVYNWIVRKSLSLKKGCISLYQADYEYGLSLFNKLKTS